MPFLVKSLGMILMCKHCSLKSEYDEKKHELYQFMEVFLVLVLLFYNNKSMFEKRNLSK